ncbi:MAG: sulfatase-like hydrolase/transferase [Verrucomicrobiaceae bacterium]|nr:sulfatase-like hydrolase/transferase [Verrucomicrobiaceae bacterium]
MTISPRLRQHAFPLYLSAVAFVAWQVLRLALWLGFKPAGATVGDALLTFVSGIHRDAVTALAATTLLIALTALITTLIMVVVAAVTYLPGFRLWRPLWPVVFRLGILIGCAAGVFLVMSEWFFFDEFESRFNTVAIDYLIYPHEVFTNIWESYPVVWIIAGCAIVGGGIWWAGLRFFPPHWSALTTGERIKTLALWLCGVVAACFTLCNGEVSFSSQRVVNELANNGLASGVRAAWSRNLSYAAFYPVADRAESFRRVRAQLAEPGAEFIAPEAGPAPAQGADGKVDPEADARWLDAARDSLVRRIAGDAARPRLNVCFIIEESLGSEFWGSMGRLRKNGQPDFSLMPEMEALARTEGMLFTRLFADGNRTIRGLEALLSSFPPLPGDSILARDKTVGVESIAQVLKRDGYETLFLYGGYGTFDYIRSYSLSNGWNRLIEQGQIVNPAHITAWGVSDEDLLHRGIEEMRALHVSGKPFLTTFLTVSNHRPFTYPAGRIPEDPNEQTRVNATKYADWALGDFFRRARQEKFWTDTIFVVVGDHGARVYGSQTIPMKSYQVPLLIAGPAVVKEPRRVDVLGCQLDVAPTVLALIGRPWTSVFFGHDLLKPDAAARSLCLMHHNRSIAVYRDDRQIVFGLNKIVEYWSGNPSLGTMQRVHQIDDAFKAIEAAGIAMFQVADELYIHGRYKLPEKLAR